MTPSTIRLPWAVAFAAALLVGAEASAQTAASAPLGTFEDDYGARHVVTDSTWQHGSSVYRVVSWHPDDRQVVLAGRSDDGEAIWMRIDWMVFDEGADVGSSTGGAPWTWAYCMAVWDAPSARAARDAPVSDRADPRAGCGEGFPFSRMRLEPAEGAGDVGRSSGDG